MRLGQVVGAVLLVCGCAGTVAAQENGGPPKETIKVFFDCPNYGACHDDTYFRREVPYVNWMRNREDADVHVLITSQTTGGGGRQFTLAFIGLGDAFDGQDQNLVVNTPAAATLDEQRGAIADKLKLGLVRYLAQTSAAAQLRILYGPPSGPGGPGTPGAGGRGRSPAASAKDDPWNYWAFSLSGNTFLYGQSSVKEGSYYGSVSANRTTDRWKLGLSVDYDLRRQRYELTDTTYTVSQHSSEVDAFVVRSMGEQFAVGLRTGIGGADSYNEDYTWAIQPGVEYDFFPYAQSSRRSLALQYVVGPRHWNYTQPTIYEFVAETRTQGSLRAALALVQPWGNWSTAVTWAHLLPETNEYHVTLNGDLSVRIAKGLSINAFAYYTWVHDQIYLSAGGVTDQDILLHLRQLHTTFTYNASIGLRYQFGSIFNNVVNTRFGGSSSVIYY